MPDVDLYWVEGLHAATGLWHPMYGPMPMSRARGLRNVLMSIDDKTGMARREHLEEYEDYRVGSPETVHIKAIKPKATDDPTPVSKAKLQEQSSRTVVKVRVKKSKR